MFFIKTILILLIIYFGFKFVQSLFIFIVDVLVWIHYKMDHCPECGEEYITYGYDDKRGCPNRCVWKRYKKDHPDLFK